MKDKNDNTPEVKHLNRETWLEAGIILIIDQVFEDLGQVDPAEFAVIPYRVACGFPVGSRGGKTVALGQTFNREISGDDTSEVVINAVMDDPIDVLPVLVHEMVHVLCGIECGHRGEFARIARAVGLEGPLTATVAGSKLLPVLETIAAELGQYPHGSIDPNARKKQGVRNLKIVCTSGAVHPDGKACSPYRMSATGISHVNFDTAVCNQCMQPGTLQASK
jgi:hypothetical protein